MRAASLWLSDMGIRLRATAAESQHRTAEEEQKPARRLGDSDTDNADVGANIASTIVVEGRNRTSYGRVIGRICRYLANSDTISTDIVASNCTRVIDNECDILVRTNATN